MQSIAQHREMRIDDLYNDTTEPWRDVRRLSAEMFYLVSRPWDLTVHGESRIGHGPYGRDWQGVWRP